MTKESIFVHIPKESFKVSPGTKEIYIGEHSRAMSEGSWVLNFALNMARHGHPTSIAGYPWGDIEGYSLPENLSLTRYFGGTHDIYVDVGWQGSKTISNFSNIKASFYVHGWRGDPSESPIRKYICENDLHNHYIARMSRCYMSLFNKIDNGIYMPSPLVQYISNMPNTNSKIMLWANRDAFTHDNMDHSEKVLGLMEGHPGYEYIVLLYKEDNFRSIRRDIIERFDRLPGVVFVEPYEGIPHDVFLNELSLSKILLDNGHPSDNLQTLESVCRGSVPLLWSNSDHHFIDDKGEYINKKFGLDGPDGIDRLLEDYGLYMRYFKELSGIASDHEYNNSHEIFMKELDNI